MVTIITFFLILSILILIHEGGHFFAAKKSGMKVLEFGFGLPPRMIGIKRGGTIYSLNWLPFGGFVKIFGENPADIKGKKSKTSLKSAFSAKPWYLRGFVIVAGPMMNFILAVIIVSYLFTKGVYLPGKEVRIVEVQKKTPASVAGVIKNDVILSLRLFDKDIIIDSSDKLTSSLRKAVGKKIVLTLKRNNQLKKINMIPRVKPPKGQGALGIVITDLTLKKYTWYQAPFIGLKESVILSGRYYQELFSIIKKLVLLQNPKVEVSGPIGIAKLTGDAVQMGSDAVIQLLGLLSLNLALINIFPFPALDGGQLAFVLFEGITKKKIDEELKNKINSYGLIFLLTLVFLITILDIRKLIK